MEKKKIILSAIILAKNEQDRIEDCLKSLWWVDELIVIDNESTDHTLHLARKHRARVIPSDSHDFSELRTIGMESTHGTWLLYIDADERVTDALRQEIIQRVRSFQPSTDPHGYYIRRKNYYLGGEWPTLDRMQRLFWKPSLRGWQGSVHETAIVAGAQDELNEPLLHITHRTLEEMVEKTNVWSAVEANMRHLATHPPVTWWRLLRVMLTGLYKSYIKESGWRAGTAGLVESIYQAFSMFITYAKLWELQEESHK